MPLIRSPRETPAPAAASRIGDLASASVDRRWSAARAAADQPDSVRDLAEALARETDARVREAICTALARIASSESVDALSPLLRSDDASVRTTAMDALRTVPKKLLGPCVAKLLVDPDADVRLLTCELVRELDPAAAQRLLLSVIEEDSQPNVCASAIDALAEIGGADAIPALARCAARFSNDAFIAFTVEAASERLGRG